jgi:FkbM family methyltransferase
MIGKRLGWYLHTFKALNRQQHAEILPLLEQYIPQDGIVIDANAGTGQFSQLLAQAAPQGHVYAFEPGRYARSIISRVIAAKKLQNVSLFPVGLGDQDSVETLAGNSGSGGCPVMNGNSTAETEKITLTTLNQFALRHNLKRVDFIRADTGGSEMKFLMGAHDIIDRFRPVLFLTINNAATAPEMWTFLKSLNYRINRLEPDSKTLTPLEVPITHGTLWCVAEERRKAG